jgi:hypothetical protein
MGPRGFKVGRGFFFFSTQKGLMLEGEGLRGSDVGVPGDECEVLDQRLECLQSVGGLVLGSRIG